jgi:DNA-binding LytR/AlgR family response regulator
MPTALIADDEPLLREALQRQLASAWPELDIIAQARNGREAIEHFELLRPNICFLDVQMPGVSGVEAARRIGRAAHLVFVTAFDHYAVEAFAQGVLDYLVKPVEPQRLAETVARLRARLQAEAPASNTEALLQRLAAQLQPRPAPLQWIRAQVGQMLRLIAAEDIDYLRSDAKYTLVAWRGDGGQLGEALVRTPLRELVPQLDATHFAQIHRACVVNLRAVSHVTRGENETATVHLKGRKETLPVSRNYAQQFRQM